VSRSSAFRVAFTILLVVYPVVIYVGLQVVPAGYFGLLLALMLAVRFGLLRSRERATVFTLLILFVYALLAVLGGERMLLLYPAVANFTMSLVFALSLWRGEPLLLRFARARGMPMSAHSDAYLRKLTAVWACFLAANGCVALWTITQTFELWALYNGFLSYLLIAALLGAEVLFRIYYKRRMGIVDERPVDG
jgi:uncharacterized membrane protein